MTRFIPFGNIIRRRLPTAGQVAAGISLLAVMFFCYVLGAAVIEFELPTSEFLGNAFAGAQAVFERAEDRPPPRVDDAAGVTVLVDKPDRTADGFTLFTTFQGSWATLIDMKGNVVHEWKKPFHEVWPSAPHVRSPLPDDQIHWFRAHLFPNGDLLALYHANCDTPYGYGLVKLDKDSKVLWAYPGNVHHDMDVGEDGRIYALTHKNETKPPAGLEFIPTPFIDDALVILSPEGQELANISILEAFRDSPYALMLSLIDKTRPKGRVPLADRVHEKGDYIHANSVKVLSRALAPKFPLFEAGQVLISMRNIDTIAVIDPQKRSIVWAATGVWRRQHDPEFLENGNLLIYDNLGSDKGVRLIEYAPVTQAIPWCYANENATPFQAVLRGVKQRLPNGNTLLVDPDRGRLLEVTRQKELVWECFAAGSSVVDDEVVHGGRVYVTGARRYGPDGLTFLKGGPRVQP